MLNNCVIIRQTTIFVASAPRYEKIPYVTALVYIFAELAWMLRKVNLFLNHGEYIVLVVSNP